MQTVAAPPEHNVTGHDYSQRQHLGYRGPIIDIHAHVMQTRPGDPANGPPLSAGPDASIAQAEMMLAVAQDFGIVRTYSMCPPEDIPVLRARFGDALHFNGYLSKKSRDDSDESAYQLLEQYLAAGIDIIKFWSAPRGRERGLFVDAPWRIEMLRRARAAGIRVVMVHVGDPDIWFRTVYTDTAKFGTKPEQYTPLRRLLEEFPDMTWIGAHMGGDPEHPDHLEALLTAYPHFYLDTSATKWQVREVSPRRAELAALMTRHADRFLFGSDLVTRHALPAEHYVSRYWCQRTLWESGWHGQSPIADPDYRHVDAQALSPPLHGLGLPLAALEKIYYHNACQLFARRR